MHGNAGKKAFTLVEVLISLVLAGILFTVVFRAYVSITQISTRLENEKKINAQIAYVTETVQNIADAYQIDYNKYGTTLAASHGFAQTLHLTGGEVTGAALSISGNTLRWIHDGQWTSLISSGEALLSQGTFKIIPFTQPQIPAFLDIQHPGFWLIGKLQTTRYNAEDRMQNVSSSLQQFYNLQRVE